MHARVYISAADLCTTGRSLSILSVSFGNRDYINVATTSLKLLSVYLSSSRQAQQSWQQVLNVGGSWDRAHQLHGRPPGSVQCICIG